MTTKKDKLKDDEGRLYAPKDDMLWLIQIWILFM